MSNYVTSTLVSGEKVMCTAHYHWFWWLERILVYAVLVGVGVAIDLLADITPVLTVITLIVALLGLGYAYLRYTHDEIVITNHRVVLKTRILARDVFEMQIQKVETIQVDQSVMGRIFNFGKISCRGTGGTTSGRVTIADPLAFRAAFQNAIKESAAPQASYATPVVTPVVQAAAPALDNDKLDEIISLLKEISGKLNIQQ